jgi:hypothetical protein
MFSMLLLVGAYALCFALLTAALGPSAYALRGRQVRVVHDHVHVHVHVGQRDGEAVANSPDRG